MHSIKRLAALTGVIGALVVSTASAETFQPLTRQSRQADVPVEFHGRWAPSAAECRDKRVRIEGAFETFPSETRITMGRNGFTGNEAGSTVTRTIRSAPGFFTYRGKASEAEDGIVETVSLRLAGPRLLIIRGSNSTSYLRCR